MKQHYKSWHHAPLHIFVPNAVYMITPSTYYKKHFYRGHQRLRMLETLLFEVLEEYGWELRVWSVFSNHYHFIARAPREAKNISLLIKRLHSRVSLEINKMDGVAGRKVWYQYWDKCLTYEKSYYARLNYVNNNAVHHGLVSEATQYPYCSAGWFEKEYSRAFQKKVASFGYDRVSERDNFVPLGCDVEP